MPVTDSLDRAALVWTDFEAMRNQERGWSTVTSIN